MRNFLESVDSEWFNQRLTRMLIIVLIAFAVIMSRLAYLQVIQGRELRKISENNSIRLQDIDAPRGLIFDRNNLLMVDNRPCFNLYVVLKDAKPLARTIEKLAHLINEPLEELMAPIVESKKRGAYAPILLKEDVGRDALAAVEVHKYDLPGIMVYVSTRRHYIYGLHAAHLLGYMGEITPGELRDAPSEDYKGGDYIGKFGIEKAYEGFLRGKRGGRQVEVNATGQVVRVINTVEAEPGQNIVLTIDSKLQHKAEEMLKGEAGSAVAIDPDNGRILAMVSSPSFDPNHFVSGMTRDRWKELISNPLRPLENKAIQSEYPPASTYKIVTAIAGLEEGVINAETTFYCPGFYRYANRPYRCWKRGGHGEVDVVKALAQSCDVFFYQVGIAVGVDRLAKYANSLGLGFPTQINLDHESRGLIPTSAWKYKRFGVPWQGGETLSIAIGQGFDLVTPLQLAVMAATVGNGGTRYKPFVVEKIMDDQGEVTFQGTPEVADKTVVHPSTLALVHKGLWDVVNSQRGTAYASRIQGLEFSGKTGTAQVIGLPKEGDAKKLENADLYKDHAWFVAYAPSENPKIAVAIMIEHGEHGASAAAPIAREMIKNYLGLDQTTEILAQEQIPSAHEETVEWSAPAVTSKVHAQTNFFIGGSTHD